jgi:hypothetical protein
MAKKKKKIKESPPSIDSIGDMEKEGVKVEFAVLGIKPMEGELIDAGKTGVLIRFQSRGKINNCFIPYANIKCVTCKQAAGEDEEEEEE